MNGEHTKPVESRTEEQNIMDPETLKALQGSIAKWEAIAAGTGSDHGPDNCTLCQKFYACEGCPVALAVDDCGCSSTPFEDDWCASNPPMRDDGGYWAETPKQKAAAQKELDFLKSLLPTGERSHCLEEQEAINEHIANTTGVRP